MLPEDYPQPVDIAVLEARLSEYNVAATGYADGRELAVWLRDADGGIAGGLYGWTWGAWLEVRDLWVREALRGQGHGRRPLGAAEAAALARGCRWAFLDSDSFQAPGFYTHLGYEAFTVLDGFRPATAGPSCPRTSPPPRRPEF